VFPIYLHFAGGKGVASGMGALLGLCPLAVVGGAVAFLLCYLPARVVSVGSLVGAAVTVALSFALGYPLPHALAATAIAVLIVLRHRSNIARLLQRRERRL
jgi:glycerol-3-phosphate acyltransferase PlsY